MKDKVSISAIFVSVLSQSFLESCLEIKEHFREVFVIVQVLFCAEKLKFIFLMVVME